jgi:hypothetical protein
MILCAVVFLVPGMNSAILGLGAGGSHPWNIPIVDKVSTILNLSCCFSNNWMQIGEPCWGMYYNIGWNSWG